MDLNLLFIILPAILIALTVHECAHAWVAFRLGDPTARDAGRLTLNPLPHLDPIGTLMLIVTTMSGYGSFGWAKPVPVNPYNFTNLKRDDILVSLAGPASNILLALVFGYTLRLLPGSLLAPGILFFFHISIAINIGIAFFNLIPVPPLDGSHILASLIPDRFLPSYYEKMRYAPLIFMGVLIADWVLPFPLFSTIINPFYKPFAAFWNFIIFFKF
jgi:Zn-dependent protease